MSLFIMAIIVIGAILLTLSMKLIKKLIYKLAIVAIFSILAYYIRSNPEAIINGFKGIFYYTLENGYRLLSWSIQYVLNTTSQIIHQVRALL